MKVWKFENILKFESLKVWEIFDSLILMREQITKYLFFPLKPKIFTKSFRFYLQQLQSVVVNLDGRPRGGRPSCMNTSFWILFGFIGKYKYFVIFWCSKKWGCFNIWNVDESHILKLIQNWIKVNFRKLLPKLEKLLLKVEL